MKVIFIRLPSRIQSRFWVFLLKILLEFVLLTFRESDLDKMENMEEPGLDTSVSLNDLSKEISNPPTCAKKDLERARVKKASN